MIPQLTNRQIAFLALTAIGLVVLSLYKLGALSSLAVGSILGYLVGRVVSMDSP